MFWVYIAEFTVLSLLELVLVYLRSPDLIKERLRPGAGERDKATIPILTILFVGQYIVAGVDAGRTHWSHGFPFALQVSGLILFAIGFGIVIWAMLVNKFFSTAVRIQEDRGQKVITSGPYQFVRHPGYAGGSMLLLGSSIGLGSWLAILLMLLTFPLYIKRTILEDDMLHKDLEGYTEYAAKVRYRIIPGVW